MLSELERLGVNPRTFLADRPLSSDVDYIHGDEAHWYVYSWGGRWRKQFNIGMYGSEDLAARIS